MPKAKKIAAKKLTSVKTLKGNKVALRVALRGKA